MCLIVFIFFTFSKESIELKISNIKIFANTHSPLPIELPNPNNDLIKDEMITPKCSLFLGYQWAFR